MLKKLCNIYQEQLFNIAYANRNEIKSKYKLSYELITLKNYKLVKNMRSPKYVNDFKKMLQYGDIGFFAKVDDKYVGYGWAKRNNSKDYFFVIDNCYLCRFYVHNDYRGANIYPNLINRIMKYLYENYSINEFTIAVEVGNDSSVNGIKKVGFQYVKSFRFIRILRKTMNKYTI